MCMCCIMCEPMISDLFNYDIKKSGFVCSSVLPPSIPSKSFSAAVEMIALITSKLKLEFSTFEGAIQILKKSLSLSSMMTNKNLMACSCAALYLSSKINEYQIPDIHYFTPFLFINGKPVNKKLAVIMLVNSEKMLVSMCNYDCYFIPYSKYITGIDEKHQSLFQTIVEVALSNNKLCVIPSLVAEAIKKILCHVTKVDYTKTFSQFSDDVILKVCCRICLTISRKSTWDHRSSDFGILKSMIDDLIDVFGRGHCSLKEFQTEMYFQQKVYPVVVEEKKLVIGDIIGKGSYGKVKSVVCDGHTFAYKMFFDVDYEKDGYHGSIFREISTLLAIDSPNVIKISYFVVSDGKINGILMEKGISDLSGKINISEKERYTADMMKAMQDTHLSLVIHKDLKLENFLLCGDGKVRLIDFGISRLGCFDTMQNMFSSCSYAPTYKPPELCVDINFVHNVLYDSRSDIWCFGCILYELWVCKMLFTGIDTCDDLNKKHQLFFSKGLPPVANKMLPENIKRIVKMCLEEEITNRPFSVDLVL